MMYGLFTSANGLRAFQTQLDVTSNDIANVNTTAYKQQTVDFKSLFYTQDFGPVTDPGTAQQIGLGVLPVIGRDFSQGGPIPTGEQLDLLIQGDGFFQVQLPDGRIAYTRDGAFQIDANGQIVTSQGLPLEPEIVLPPDTLSVNVAPDGTVSVITAGDPTPQVIGQIETARFINPEGLLAGSGNLFFETGNSGEPMVGEPGTEARGTLIQGSLEASNVDIVTEFTNLITAQNNFQFNASVFQTADEMIQSANNLVRVFG
ncbi:MAG: flagellar basal-body rod protein FlgG [Planctomycetes bacterium]|nr:flagellar basal-body rod protein FlgG [Planctomycetota bacterium]